MKPQLENGFIRIATEIWRELGHYRLSGEEWLVLNCILGKTYGFNKKEDKISISQFYEWTGMKKPSIIRALKKLIDKNIVSKKANANIPTYCFNKQYSTWKTLAKKLTVSNSANAVSKKANKTLAKKLPTIDNKDTITKDITLRVTEFGNSDINFLSKYFLETMKIPVEDCSKGQSRQYWNLLLKASKTGAEGVKWLIDQAAMDEYYRNNITSSKDLYYKRIKIIARKRQKGGVIDARGIV